MTLTTASLTIGEYCSYRERKGHGLDTEIDSVDGEWVLTVITLKDTLNQAERRLIVDLLLSGVDTIDIVVGERPSDLIASLLDLNSLLLFADIDDTFTA